MDPKDSTKHIVTFRIKEIPDPSYPLFQVAARGDVLSAVANGFEHIMRIVGHRPADNASLAIGMAFNPTAADNTITIPVAPLHAKHLYGLRHLPQLVFGFAKRPFEPLLSVPLKLNTCPSHGNRLRRHAISFVALTG